MSFPANRIAEIRKRRNMSQQQLAEKVGAHSVTISNLERGRAHLSHEWTEKLAKALRVDWSALVAHEPPVRIFVEGWVKESGLYWNGGPGLAVDVELGFTRTLAASWLLIYDDTMYPVFSKGDLLRVVTIDDVDKSELDPCFGRLCLLQTEEDPDNSQLGFLTRGTGDKVGLTRVGKPPIHDVTLKSIHVVDRAFYRPVLPKTLTYLADVLPEYRDKLLENELSKPAK